MRYLLILVLFSSCSVQYHIDRVIKKDPKYFKTVAESRARYFTKYDTIYNHTEGRIDTIIKKEPYPVIEYVTKQTWKEKRVDNKIAVLNLKEAREELKRSKLSRDSLKLSNTLLKEEIRHLKAETKKTNQETRQIKKENRSNSIEWIFDNLWWLIILLIALVVSVFVFRKRQTIKNG